MGAVSNAVATQEQAKKVTASGIVEKYQDSFAKVLPTHVRPDTWVRLTQGALKRGQWDAQNNRYLLETCALSKPAVFMAACLDAARLGLNPGTEEYYLTPRKVKGAWQILGIVGYQGMIELMYRAGAVASVIVEPVYTNDTFRYQPGRQEVPEHEIDWDAESRGELRLVYAYARMVSGATSKVVVLNKAAINKIMASSESAKGDYSPWKTHTEAMWMKSAVRQLYKWVPTSAEYRREQLRASMEVAQQVADNLGDRVVFHDSLHDDVLHDEADEDGVVEAEVVPAVQGPVVEPQAHHEQAAPESLPPTPPEPPEDEPEPPQTDPWGLMTPEEVAEQSVSPRRRRS